MNELNNDIYSAEYAGHVLHYSFVHPLTRFYFRGRMKEADLSTMHSGDRIIRSDEEKIQKCGALSAPDTDAEYLEYRTLISLTSLGLLPYRCCIFHAAAFVFQGKAFLLTAPSGTGKTTQFLNWRNSHPEEIRMISGDMPVISAENTGTIQVYPTNWNGKENLGTQIDAPLGGIIYLEQAKVNEIVFDKMTDLVIPIFRQFIVTLETTDEIRQLTKITEQMLKSCPVWKFRNDGTISSTEMLRSAIIENI